MISTFKSLIERFPALEKPAYYAFTGIMGAKNIVYAFLYRRFGFAPRRMSDRGQDRWVIDDVYQGKKGGFFVDFGAFDGFSESNTFVLEKHFDWNGLCVEPNPENYRRLTKVYGRTCECVPLAIDPEGGSLEFVMDGQRSGLILDDADNSLERRGEELERARAEGRIKVVEALPFQDLLARYNAPKVIDYLSLDVEGSETRVMRHFPFDQYTFLAMTIERPTVELNEILFKNGYHFVKNSLYDTFYIHESNPRFDEIKKEPFEQLPEKGF